MLLPSDGILLVDKPTGWTSFDVVAKLRGRLRVQTGSKKVKVGHGGTLDPFATGLLIILVGKACKQADQLLKFDKTYQFTIVLGKTSTTGDPEGDITGNSAAQPVSEETLRTTIRTFRGELSQVPPAFSAIKVNGQRAYALARKGKPVALEPRRITVHTLEVTSYAWPEVVCVARVSSGTYIRTLAEDIGTALGTGGYCSQLRRTSVGPHDITAAHALDYYLDS